MLRRSKLAARNLTHLHRIVLGKKSRVRNVRYDEPWHVSQSRDCLSRIAAGRFLKIKYDKHITALR